MRFYVMLPSDKEEDAIPVGELSFDTLYTEAGFWLINRQIVQDNKDFTESAIVINERAEKYSVQEFIDMLFNQNIGLK